METTGVPDVIRQAVDATRILGTCGLVGGASVGEKANLDANDLLAGRTVRGISQGDSVPSVFIPRLIDLYRQDRFPFDELISFYEFEEINQAIEDSVEGRTIKPVLRISEI